MKSKTKLASWGVFYAPNGADSLITARNSYGIPIQSKISADERLSDIRAAIPISIHGAIINKDNQHTLFVKRIF